MAADVGYLVRVMSGYNNNNNNNSSNNIKEEQQHHHHHHQKSTALVTRDLLGGGGGSFGAVHSKELDLDLQVPNGYEKRLDLKSGKVYLQKCNSQTTSENKHRNNQTVSTKLQDLNFPPKSKQTHQHLNLFDDTNLELKLVQSSNYQSVCTLDKVKSALERAEKETIIRKRSISMSKSSSPSNSSSSIKDHSSDHMDIEEKCCPSVAAGCPSCLLYVLITKSNPRCPRCNMIVPSPMPLKKPRIDLNISI